jgi:acyl carrier protein
MTVNALEMQVREIVAEQLGLTAEEVADEATFAQDLGADVLDLLELMMAFEEEFDLEISDLEAEGLRTVQDVVAFIGQRRQQA